MDVYVETNFVLELALQQEQHGSCRELLQLAKAELIRLILPAYSLIEPHETLPRNAKRRKKLAEELTSELGQVGRSLPYLEFREASQNTTSLLLRVDEEERLGMQKAAVEILKTTEIISLTSSILSEGFQNKHRLSMQDSIVFASIVDYMKLSGAKTRCFLTKNSKDFNDPNITDELKSLSCHALFSFENGLNYIKSQI